MRCSLQAMSSGTPVTLESENLDEIHLGRWLYLESMGLREWMVGLGEGLAFMATKTGRNNARLVARNDAAEALVATPIGVALPAGDAPIELSWRLHATPRTREKVDEEGTSVVLAARAGLWFHAQAAGHGLWDIQLGVWRFSLRHDADGRMTGITRTG